MTVVAGIDGCRAGWFGVIQNLRQPGRLEWCCVPRLTEFFDRYPKIDVVGIDMPIGLLDIAEPGGRACDRAARAQLGPGRAASVFSPPVRAAMAHLDDYASALRANRESGEAGLGISKQCFHIMPKIAEVDDWITPARQEIIREVHPELAFAAMNGGHPLVAPKRKAEGHAKRRVLVESVGLGAIEEAFGAHPRHEVAPDDILDAAACCWAASRIARNEATRLPSGNQCDSTGLKMEIWY